uniref:F-box domain-containing protein n=1 Tax=Caenorhabditis tropicalis TaxID=1561998 RepID=A0A1I7UI76_9PELO
MSKFIENLPSAIEVWMFYKRKEEKSGLYEKLCDVIGENGISEESFIKLFDTMTMENGESKRKEIRQLVTKNQANLRICILSDVIDKKSIVESVLSITKMIGTHDIDSHDFEFWFNRFSSGNWSLYRKTFSDLPIEVVESIVEDLDFPSQMRLRRVSHGLRNIVDQMTPSIDQIDIYIERQGSQNTLNLSIRKSKGPESDIYWGPSYHGEDNLKKAFDGMKVLLSNPRLRLESFIWKNESSSEIDDEFIDVINSLNHKIEIRDLAAKLNGDSMVDLMEAIKPGILEEIDFYGNFNQIQFDRLVQLEQWKKAKMIYLCEFIPDFTPHFRHFQNFEDVTVQVKSVSMDDILLLLIQNDKFKKFAISVEEDKPSESEIEETLGLSEMHFNEEDEWFYGRYDIPGTNDYLNVIIDDYRIKFLRITSD